MRKQIRKCGTRSKENCEIASPVAVTWRNSGALLFLGTKKNFFKECFYHKVNWFDSPQSFFWFPSCRFISWITQREKANGKGLQSIHLNDRVLDEGFFWHSNLTPILVEQPFGELISFFSHSVFLPKHHTGFHWAT